MTTPRHRSALRSLSLPLALALAACGGASSGPGPGPDAWVFYGLRVAPGDAGWDLWAVREDGSGALPLAATAAGEGFEVAVTPGGRVVYAVVDGLGWADLWSVRLDGTDPQVVSATAEQDLLVAVLPGERLLVQTSSPETGTDLLAVGADGSDPVLVAGSANRETAFAVTPGGRLVYALRAAGISPRRLRSVALDGTGDVALLPSAGDEDQSPSFLAADGRVLVVVYPADGGSLLRSVPAAGGEAATLWDHDTMQKTVEGVSAAGVAVIRVREEGAAQDDLYAVPADGSAAPALIAGSTAVEYFAGFTPDGRILYQVVDEAGHRDLHLIRPDGAGDLVIAPTAASEILEAVADDGRIVFGRGDGQARDVLVHDPATGVTRPLAAGAEWEETVGLLGTRLVFVRRVGDLRELHAVDLDGGGATPLVTGLPGVWLHALTPAGQAIFSSDAGDDAYDLHAVGLDGQGLHPLAATAQEERFLGLSP